MKLIPNYPEYAANEIGEIIRLVSRTNSKAGNYLKPRKGTNGYYYVNLSKPGTKAKNFSVHSLVLLAHGFEKPSQKHQAAHLDGDQSNNKLENLKWVTSKENNSHKLVHGTQRQGEECGCAKITADTVMKIIAQRALGNSSESVGASFGISGGMILRIEKGKAWKHLGLKPVTDNRCIGELNHATSLSNSQVSEIKIKLQQGSKGIDLAKEFSVTKGTISNIKIGKTWKHIQ